MSNNSYGWETINSSGVPSNTPPKLSKKKQKKKQKKRTPKNNNYKRSQPGLIALSQKLPINPHNSNSEWVTTDDEQLSSTPDNSTEITPSKYHQIKDNITRRYEEYERNPVNFLNTFLEASKEQPDKFVEAVQGYNDTTKHSLKHLFFIIKMTVPTTSRSKSIHNTTFCLMTSDGVYPIDYMNVNNTVDPFSDLQVKKKKQKSKGMKSLLNGLKVAGSSICSNEIGKGYITEQYTDYNTIGVISFGLHKKHTRGLKTTVMDILHDITLVNKYDVVGFVYCEPYKPHPIDAYIPLICSNKNFGGVLLKFIENLASFIGYEKMQLSAIDTAVSYYYFKSNYIIKRGGKHTLAFNYELSRFIKKPIEGSVKTRGGGGENINRVVLNSTLTKKTHTHPKASRKSKRIQSLKATPHKEYTLFNVAVDENENIKMIKILKIYK